MIVDKARAFEGIVVCVFQGVVEGGGLVVCAFQPAQNSKPDNMAIPQSSAIQQAPSPATSNNKIITCAPITSVPLLGIGSPLEIPDGEGMSGRLVGFDW